MKNPGVKLLNYPEGNGNNPFLAMGKKKKKQNIETKRSEILTVFPRE
jgi:hypothetical protein